MSGATNDPGSAGAGAIRRLLDHDLVYSFLSSPLTVVAAVVTGVIFIATG
ncbi:MAG: ABC transporter permease, partial [Proteobacteria bacterium]|nr:ABC transporter permease [Pseudomonadota bacterium]